MAGLHKRNTLGWAAARGIWQAAERLQPQQAASTCACCLQVQIAAHGKEEALGATAEAEPPVQSSTEGYAGKPLPASFVAASGQACWADVTAPRFQEFGYSHECPFDPAAALLFSIHACRAPQLRCARIAGSLTQFTAARAGLSQRTGTSRCAQGAHRSFCPQQGHLRHGPSGWRTAMWGSASPWAQMFRAGATGGWGPWLGRGGSMFRVQMAPSGAGMMVSTPAPPAATMPGTTWGDETGAAAPRRLPVTAA